MMYFVIMRMKERDGMKMAKPPRRTKPAPPPRKKAPPPPPNNKSGRVMTDKTFSIAPWDGYNEGEKIIIHGESGMGKTTLAAQLDEAVWIGIDDGGRKMRSPVTGELLNAVQGIESFDDVRAALQSSVFDSSKHIVIDTITALQSMGLQATFNRVKIKGGATAANIEDYGYHKGYRHWYDTMLMILDDCDRHIRAGRNVIMLAQSSVTKRANAGGEDYLVESLDLYHDKNVSTHDAYKSWADQVWRIGYAHTVVEDGKVAGSTERAIYTQPEAHFVAKSRGTALQDYPIVSFSKQIDDSIWRLMFNE